MEKTSGIERRRELGRFTHCIDPIDNISYPLQLYKQKESSGWLLPRDFSAHPNTTKWASINNEMKVLLRYTSFKVCLFPLAVS